MDEFDKWVMSAAGEVVRHVERHGVDCTWSEARDALMTQAGRGEYQLVIPLTAGEEVPADVEVITEKDGNRCVPLCNPRDWRDPDFVEDTACALVHFAGVPYHPSNPFSNVNVAVPFVTMAEAVVRLGCLQQVHLERQDVPAEAKMKAAAEVLRVSSALNECLHDEIVCVVDQGGLDRQKIGSSDVVLCRAVIVSTVIRLLEEGSGLLGAVLDGKDAPDWVELRGCHEALWAPPGGPGDVHRCTALVAWRGLGFRSEHSPRGQCLKGD